MRNFCFLFIAFLLFSCQENKEPEVDPNNLLLGTWGNATYNNSQTSFKRITSLPDNEYAISFLSDSSLIERSSGWCGTPPLSFFNIVGTWQQEGSLISISTQGFVGFYNWKIISLTETDLIVEYQTSQQEQDHRDLMGLFEEIAIIATSITCNNSSDWSFTPYGSKACGGPQGYIAYSNQVDVSAFLTLIENYKLAEHNYNIQWGVISTCDVIAQPTSISCENGIAVLNY